MRIQENKYLIDNNNTSSRYGIISGLFMAIALLLFQISGNDYMPALKFLKYIFLAIPIVFILNMYKHNLNDRIFVKGFSLGAKLSMIAGFVLIISNVILYLVAPEYSFSKFTIEPSSWVGMALVSLSLFFETFVIGSLITFITVQYLKEKSRR